MHCMTTRSSPQEEGERGHPEPDSNTATEQVDCSIKGGQIHLSGGQGECHVFT